MTIRRISSSKVSRDLKTLGHNLSIARLRRRMTQAKLAEIAKMSAMTLRRLEKGDPGVSLGNLCMVMLVLSPGSSISSVLQPSGDIEALEREIVQLPKRARGLGRAGNKLGRSESMADDDGQYRIFRET